MVAMIQLTCSVCLGFELTRLHAHHVPRHVPRAAGNTATATVANSVPDTRPISNKDGKSFYHSEFLGSIPDSRRRQREPTAEAHRPTPVFSTNWPLA